MTIFYVYQNQTYKFEHDGGYVWSPQRTKNGNQNAGYKTMTEIKKGDFIIHHAGTAVKALSIATSDCYEASQPQELQSAKTSVDWGQEGYRVDVKYIDLDTPLDMRTCQSWLASHPETDSAFSKDGKGLQRYMCHVADNHVRFLMEQVLQQHQSENVVDVIKRVLQQIDQGQTAYSEELAAQDQKTANLLTGAALQAKAVEASKHKVAPRQMTSTTYYRNPIIAKAAKERANGICQLCGKPAPFNDQDGRPYLESHHIVWLSQGGEDTVENTVALCPNCHKRMHVLKDEADVKKLQHTNLHVTVL